jgi:Family of unknown function (DUF6232)
MSAELFQRPEIYFYRHNGTTITSRSFTTPNARYQMRDLTRFAQSQREAESGLMIGLITAAIELVIVLPTMTILSRSIGFALIVPALVVPFLAAYFYGKRRPPMLELLAHHRGQQVTLFTTSDQQLFGQVARALMRAAEAADR